MKKNIVIVLLAICVLGLGGFLVYDKVLKEDTKENVKEENKIEQVEKLDDSKDYYYYEKTEQFAELVCANEGYDPSIGMSVDEYFKNIDFFTKDSMIEFKYPVINIKSEDVKKINLDIERKIQSLKNEYTYNPYNFEEGCMKYTLIDSDKVHSDLHLQYYSYEIFESDNYISINEFDNATTGCASGWHDIINSYIIDKNTGKQLTKDDIVELYDVDTKNLGQGFEEALGNEHGGDYEDGVFDLQESINSGDYLFYIDSKEELHAIFYDYHPYVIVKLKNNKWVYVSSVS